MKFLFLLFDVPLRISWILEIFIKNSSYTNKQCPDSIASADTLWLCLRKVLGSKTLSYCRVPGLVAFCQMVTIHTSFLPGRDINPQAIFAPRRLWHNIWSLHSPGAEAESCLCWSRPLGECHRFRATVILVIHGWLYQGAAAWSSWSEEHSNLMFPTVLFMAFAPFVLLRWLD